MIRILVMAMLISTPAFADCEDFRSCLEKQTVTRYDNRIPGMYPQKVTVEEYSENWTLRAIAFKLEEISRKMSEQND